MKKTVALLTALLMTVSLLSGCTPKPIITGSNHNNIAKLQINSSDELFEPLILPYSLTGIYAENWLSADERSIPVLNLTNLTMLKKMTGNIGEGGETATVYLFMDNIHGGVEGFRYCFIAVEYTCYDSKNVLFRQVSSMVSKEHLQEGHDTLEVHEVEFYCTDGDGQREIYFYSKDNIMSGIEVTMVFQIIKGMLEIKHYQSSGENLEQEMT